MIILRLAFKYEFVIAIRFTEEPRKIILVFNKRACKRLFPQPIAARSLSAGRHWHSANST